MDDQVCYVIYKYDGDVFRYNKLSWVQDVYNARPYDLLSAIHGICSFCQMNGRDPSSMNIALLEVVNGVINYSFPVWTSDEPLNRLRLLIGSKDDDKKLEHTLRHDKLYTSMHWLGYK